MTLDQLQLFCIIAKLGSFSAAARQVHRAPSAVSTAIKNLEDEWGVELFDREGYRPELSPAGRSLFAQIESILSAVTRLENHVEALEGGKEPLLNISVNNLFPIQVIEKSLSELQRTFPETSVNLSVDHVEVPMQRLIDGDVDIAITLKAPQHESVLDGIPLIDIELIGVASPRYVSNPKIAMMELSKKTQIVVSSFRADDDAAEGVVATRRWSVADFASKSRLLLKGLGYGYMPDYLIRSELKSKKLIELKSLRRVPTPIVAYRRDSDPMGPAKSLFWNSLSSAKHRSS